MTDSERVKCTPHLTDLGWVFLRHFDFPELDEGKISDETKRRAWRATHDRWCAGKKIHGWTVVFPQ